MELNADQILALSIKYYSGKTERVQMVEEMIAACDTGHFKLEDSEFTETIARYGVTEEDAMVWMVELSKDRGSFMRVPYGWIFIEEVEDPGDYNGRLFFKPDGTLDHKFINSIAD